MKPLSILLANRLPEGFPAQIKVPGYFLEAISSPAGIWCVRAAVIALFFLVVMGFLHYDARAAREQQKSEEE